MCFGIRVIQIFSCQFLVSAGFDEKDDDSQCADRKDAP